MKTVESKYLVSAWAPQMRETFMRATSRGRVPSFEVELPHLISGSTIPCSELERSGYSEVWNGDRTSVLFTNRWGHVYGVEETTHGDFWGIAGANGLSLSPYGEGEESRNRVFWRDLAKPLGYLAELDSPLSVVDVPDEVHPHIKIGETSLDFGIEARFDAEGFQEFNERANMLLGYIHVLRNAAALNSFLED
jgi:hypothetical protein